MDLKILKRKQRWDGTVQTHAEDRDGNRIVKTEGDFSALYENNQAERLETGLVKDVDGWRGRQIADIDPMTILRWKQDGFDFFDYSNPNRGKELKARLLNEPWLLTTDKRFELK